GSHAEEPRPRPRKKEEQDEHDRRREPRAARSRQNERGGDDRYTNRGDEESGAHRRKKEKRQSERRNMRDEVAIAERPARHASERKERDSHAVRLKQSGRSGDDHGNCQRVEKRPFESGIAKRSRRPEDQDARDAHRKSAESA